MAVPHCGVELTRAAPEQSRSGPINSSDAVWGELVPCGWHGGVLI
jgi:hypothetical protein